MASLREIQARLRQRIDTFIQEIEPTPQKIADILLKGIHEQTGLTDHSLKELRKMGHPYRIRDGGYAGATKAGKWRAGIKKKARIIREQALGHDIKLVHIQSEKLWNAMYSKVGRERGYLWARAGVDDKQVPYVEYVVKGTRKMIPRDFIGRAAVAVRNEVRRAVRESLNYAIRRAR